MISKFALILFFTLHCQLEISPSPNFFANLLHIQGKTRPCLPSIEPTICLFPKDSLASIPSNVNALILFLLFFSVNFFPSTFRIRNVLVLVD